MKIIIQGNEMTKEDLTEIGKFLTKFFKHRKDLIGVFIEEGTEDMTKEECAKFISDMFEDREHYTKIIEKLGETRIYNPDCECGHKYLEHLIIGLLVGACNKCKCRGFREVELNENK